MPQMPQFTHDSDCCTFLGSYDADRSYDLYACVSETQTSVLARYGDDGPDYTSGLRFADSDDVLGEARRRAVASGLLS